MNNPGRQKNRDMNFSPADRDFMTRALSLAQRGLYTTTPNPRVGCVIVRDGQVIGEGWHEKAGGAHAEVAALAQKAGAGGTAQGATAYVTLEPCNHFGRTPPCVERDWRRPALSPNAVCWKMKRAN
jgi:diaminohydroxyphosphoribosylaminopyrimidine deaminase/5-amino-6-(5-phosphoribosylamino)uracil reductase